MLLVQDSCVLVAFQGDGLHLFTRKCISLYPKAFLKSKIIPVPMSRCPPRAISWFILAPLFPFIRTQQNTTSSRDLCFFHLFVHFVHFTQKHSVSCRALFLDSCRRSGKMQPFPTEFYLHLRLFGFSRLRPVLNRTQVRALSAPNEV